MRIRRRPFTWLLTGAFITALVVRLAVTIAFTGLAAPPNLGANPDQAEYEQITFNVSQGLGYAIHGAPTAVRPPGFTLTVLPIYLLFGQSFAAIRLWLILLSALTCLLVAAAARPWAGRGAAVIAAWWLAVYPGHFYYAMHLLSETIYAFWLSAAIALTIASLRRRPSALARRPALAAWAAGVCWTMAILTRVELIVIIPIAWVLAACSRERRAAWKTLAVPTAIVLVCVSVWVGRNMVSLGTPTLSTQRGCTFWGAHNDTTFTSSRVAGTWVNCSDLVNATHPMAGDELTRERLALTYGLEATRDHASRIPYLLTMKVWRLVSPFFDTPNRAALWTMAVGWIVAVPFVLAGFALTCVRRRYRHPIALVLMAPLLATLVTTLLFYGSARYRDAVTPVLLIFAAVGLTAAARLETAR